MYILYQPDGKCIIHGKSKKSDVSSGEVHHIHPEGHNIVIKAEYLHVLGDLAHSSTIVITAILIHFFPQLWFLDPACTLLFVIVVIWTTKDTLLEAINMLMEATPDDLNPKEIR
jgi:Co/Zn/Cd efflux system component